MGAGHMDTGGGRPREFYPSLMGLAEIASEMRAELEQLARERTNSGMALMSSRLEKLAAATSLRCLPRMHSSQQTRPASRSTCAPVGCNFDHARDLPAPREQLFASLDRQGPPDIRCSARAEGDRLGAREASRLERGTRLCETRRCLLRHGLAAVPCWPAALPSLSPGSDDPRKTRRTLGLGAGEPACLNPSVTHNLKLTYL